MQSRWRTALGGEINLAPLLDVIFCLLFFFILATSLRKERQALEIQIPRSDQTARKVDETRSLEVLIMRDNQIVFQDRPVTPDQLVQALKQARRDLAAEKGRAPDEILIRTDGQADVQTFIEVSDACAKAGLKAALMEAMPKPGSDTSP